MSGRSSEGDVLCLRCVWNCGICSAVCKYGAITLSRDDLRVNLAICSRCGACVAACPAAILEEAFFE